MSLLIDIKKYGHIAKVKTQINKKITTGKSKILLEKLLKILPILRVGMMVNPLFKLAPHLFIHGGKNIDGPSSSTYFLDTINYVWKKVFTMDQPIARYQHACAKTNSKEVFIFGGFNEKKNNNFGDLHKFDYNNLQFDSTDIDRVGGAYWNLIYDSVNTKYIKLGTKTTSTKRSPNVIS